MKSCKWLSIVWMVSEICHVLVVADTGICLNSWMHINGSCYKISSDRVNWNAAKSACETMGSGLATVKSQNEQQALAPRIKDNTWIGLHRVSYHRWLLIWVDGTRPSYTNFYPGQPDHYGGYENCVHMLLREGQVKWNDISCSVNMLYICEMNGACPNDWIHLNGSCYKISSDKLNWNAAKSACEAMGSELATVKSQNEQQALAPRIKDNTWIGLHRVSYLRWPLIWVDGTRPSYTNFYPGQPDHYRGYEDCVHMLLREGQVKWNDISCSVNMLYICEMNVLPSAPRDVAALFVNESAVRITWTPPLITGSGHVFYDVHCLKPLCEGNDKCRDTSCGGHIGYVPKMEGLNVPQVAVTNLLPFENYTFKIYPFEENGLRGNFGTLTIKTLESAPGKPEVFLELLEENTIRISWKLDRKNGIILAYNLTYTNMDNPQDTQSIKTTNTTLILSGLKPGESYSFVVTAENRAGRSSSKMKTFLTSDVVSYSYTNPSGQNSRQTTYIVISVILGVILLIVLIVLGICYRRRKTQFRPVDRLGNQQHLEVSLPLEREEVQMDLLPVTNTDTDDNRKRPCSPVAKSGSLQDLQRKEVNVPPQEEMNETQHLLLETSTEDCEDDGQYLESDLSHTHDDQFENTSQTRSFELEREDIRFQRLLGSGNFGEVHKAVIGNNIVAAKSLKGKATPKDRSDMISELNVMKSLKPHPYVLKLIGCCTLSDPLLIVLEYLPYGDLLGYLRKSRGHADVYNSGEKTPTSSLSAKDLLSFAWMIADGMKYLAKMKIVHRDLAARNILVGEDNVCKISDFGLARDIKDDIYMLTSQARLPVKWMPPESLFHGESGTMSDVWSYGIVLWEVFTIGDSPYPGVKAMKVAALLERGYRMPRPNHISEELYAIMSECWSEQPEERPSFHWICAAVKRLIDDEKIYINLDYYNDEDYVNFDMIEGLQ